MLYFQFLSVYPIFFPTAYRSRFTRHQDHIFNMNPHLTYQNSSLMYYKEEKQLGLSAKLLLIINEQHNFEEAQHTIQKVMAIVRKIIVSGKQGESALKFYQDGTYICPVDTIVDALKLLDDAIIQAGCKDLCGIGIVWLAESFFNPDKKNYELDNPKQLFDTDQLIDYYFKMCNEKQLICYMEDPLVNTDTKGWQKLIQKFKGTKVKIGSRKLYANMDQVKQYGQTLSAETNPDLTSEYILERNSQTINLDYAFFKPYELATFTCFKAIVNILQNKEFPTFIILGNQLTDTEDTTIIDLSFSIPNCCLNVNAPIKYEKQLKFNRIQEILFSNKENKKETTQSLG